MTDAWETAMTQSSEFAIVRLICDLSSSWSFLSLPSQEDEYTKHRYDEQEDKDQHCLPTSYIMRPHNPTCHQDLNPKRGVTAESSILTIACD